MASIGHIAVGMAAARAHRPQQRGWQLALAMCAWSLLSLVPDADVIGFRFGIPYASSFGHRGASHSLLFALALGCAIGALAWRCGARSARMTALYASAVLLSHPLLDSLTDGGLGCALFWPFDQRRYFAPWTPIPVAPIGRAYFSRHGWQVALVELVQFTPCLLYALWPRTRLTAPPA